MTALQSAAVVWQGRLFRLEQAELPKTSKTLYKHVWIAPVTTKPRRNYREVLVFRQVDSMNRTTNRLLLCSAYLSAVVVCALAAFLLVGVASASAYSPSGAEEAEAEAHEERFVDRPEGITEGTQECDETCHEGAPAAVPPGWYLTSRIAGFSAIRVLEYGEDDCRNAEKDEGCVAYRYERPEPSTEYLAPGFKELSEVIESGHIYGDEIRSLHVVFIYAWKPLEKNTEQLGTSNASEPNRKPCLLGHPVNCATGNQVETQTDLAVGGRGLGLDLTRTYNSQLAARQKEHGAFGFGWTGSYSAHLELGYEAKEAVVYQDNGATATFGRSEIGAAWTPASSLSEAILADEGSGYVYTLPDQMKMYFNSEGKLTREADRNGNPLTMSYEAGHLISVTDGAGRKLTFSYNSEGEVESAKDPMGHTVKYTYESGNLMSVTQPAESALRWQFKYNSEHELISETDGRKNTVTTEYNSHQQVISQTDALGRKREWEYKGSGTSEPETSITEPNGSRTLEKFNEAGRPLSVIRNASGTPFATTTTYEYNDADELTATSDPDKHKTEYGYDSAGNLASERDADGDEWKWTYDSKHDIDTETTPDGETTTLKRNSAGDPEVIERPAPGSTTQKTTYKYDGDGDVESVTNPLEHTWKYEYNSYGDRKAEVDPEGNKRTWEYNEDSQETATVSPRGNAEGAEASKFTTKIELNAKGRPLKITDPLGNTTKYAYDNDGNVETMTDGDSHKTKYTYDADNELTETEEPNKAITETEYDSMGRVKRQIDGNKAVTKYVRNAFEEVEEVVNPLGKRTLKEYDAAGNLIKLTDPAGRTTSYTYDPASRLTEVSYSSGNPATVKYEYNKDGFCTKMTDGTGTTTYTPDQLDRLTESENGHKEVIKYEYNLGSQQTRMTYPNTKVVERAYDKDGRLEKITDWNKKETKFAYDEDSYLKTVTFPSETKDVDTYAYNHAGQMTDVKMKRSSETLGSLVYTRDDDGQVKKTTSKDLPGAEVTEDVYDENGRLAKSGTTEYKYDAANNPTAEGLTTNTFNEGDELEKGTGVTYSYDELGERTKTTPEKGPATTYGYDQAGNLISAERPKEGEASEIKDTYAYNGEDLRTSQTVSGTTTYLAWDMAEEVPSILSDGTNSYIYGADGLPVEQINNTTGTVTYLHDDQAGSTRLLTGSTGKTEGSYSYNAYGTSEHTGTATTPLGYDAEYTSSDTGLVYMRARTYDPATAQFLTVDPAVALTREPYAYGGDNPVNRRDPDGLSAEGIEGVPCYWPLCGPPPPAVEGVQHGVEGIKHGIESVWNEVNENEGPNDEGEAALKEKEAERENACDPTPPGYDPETWTKGPASRAKEPDENYYDPEGGEWHYHAPDRHHEVPHWDYKRLPGKLAPWEEIPIE